MTSSLPGSHDPDVLAGLLADPTRRAIYLHIQQRMAPASVNEIAAHFGVHRNAAKFHLDKLLEADLLRAEFRRVNGKKGPGAGRPSKLYSATEGEISFTIPERHYDVLASLLLKALTSGDSLEGVGRSFGAELASAARTGSDEDMVDQVRRALEGLGFDATVTIDDDGCIWVTTQNCPFGRVALEAPNQEVCRLDRAIVQGLLEGFGSVPVACVDQTSKAMGHELCVRQMRPASHV